MLRTEDLIKQSGIIEYLEERKDYYLEQANIHDNCANNHYSYIYDELNHIIKHFKELSENED